MKLLKVDSVEKVQDKIWEKVVGWELETEKVTIDQAFERVLAEDIVSRENIPGFRRSTMDGYAVLAKDTGAAGESIPVFLKNKGRIKMGENVTEEIKSGECMEISTGAMLPKGADSVVMVEYSDTFGSDGIALYNSVAIGENIVLEDEDVKKGSLVLSKGQRLLPQNIGSLASLGLVEVEVYKPIAITIISTGNEIVEIDKTPDQGEVRDVNSFLIKALAEKNGFKVQSLAIVKDDEKLLGEKAREAMENSKLVVISGGSSQGKKDYTREVIDSISSPGVFTHGMAIKPGKPTIVGYDEESESLLIGLPGHPVSAMLVFDILFTSMSRKLMGLEEAIKIPAALTVNVSSSPGRMTCYPVKLIESNGSYLAKPIFGKSGLINILREADGYFKINRNSEGLKEGERVLVKLF